MKFTIIYTPTIDWGFMQQRPHRIMEQFARHGHQVLYMNQTQVPGKPMEEVEPNLFVVHDHREVLMTPKHHPVVLWMSWAKTQAWMDVIKPDLAVYDCLDDFEQWREYEYLLVPRIDMVVTTAEALYSKMQNRHHNIVMAKNGCEYDHFADPDAHPVPADWPVKSGKAVGYVGALGHWVDHELILKVAREWPVVLIGPPFGMPNLQHDNIYRLGMKPYSELPGYMRNMGALIIPFKLNDITRATNPIKMYEYLATGKPVITTDMPEALLHPEVMARSSHISFMTAVHESMVGKHQRSSEVEARKRVARENSWEARYDTIIEALENTANIKFAK